jgi:hypothetical protein
MEKLYIGGGGLYEMGLVQGQQKLNNGSRNYRSRFSMQYV